MHRNENSYMQISWHYCSFTTLSSGRKSVTCYTLRSSLEIGSQGLARRYNEPIIQAKMIVGSLWRLRTGRRVTLSGSFASCYALPNDPEVRFARGRYALRTSGRKTTVPRRPACSVSQIHLRICLICSLTRQRVSWYPLMTLSVEEQQKAHSDSGGTSGY